MVKNLPAMQETWFNPRVGKIPWRRKWQPTPVFLPGESRGQRRLMGYSPWGHEESDMTEMTQHTREKGMATHSSILAWRIPWTEETDGLQSMRSQTVKYD